MSPTVSVVIPLFNGLPFVTKALESVLNQTRPVDQIVITDGGSNDGSREWLRELNISNLLREELPVGTTAGQNWTRCSELASGDYVKLLCQDDFLYPRAIELQVADLENHPECAMAVSKRDIVDATERTIASARGCQGLEAGLIDGPEAIKTSYIKGTNIFGEPLSVLFRRDAMMSALPWDDDNPYVLDILFYTRVLAHSSLFVRNDALGAFRVSESSWSTHLASFQKSLFQSWQRGALPLLTPLTTRERIAANTNVRLQTLTRRLAYGYLSVRRRLQ